MYKMLISTAISITLLHHGAARANDDSARQLIIGAIAGIFVYKAAESVAEHTYKKGYMVHDGKKITVSDPYKDTGIRNLGDAHETIWDKSENPKAFCDAKEKSGAYYGPEGCAVWISTNNLRRCHVVTKNTTTHEALGRLYVACKNGG